MSRISVSIGVDHVNNAAILPPLQAAAAGARQFAAWAAKQGFETHELTDSTGALTAGDVKKTIRAIVGQGTCTQLVVYFAGHGLLRSWDTEVWLLSNAADDPNEAVNLAGSISLARNSGIPHVVFISDACRSFSADPRLTQVVGSIIFPIQPVISPRPEVDTFYATLPGDPSYELPPADAARAYRGIFTECLLDGLHGPTAETCETVTEGGQKICVVSSRTLKPWLEAHVPLAIGAVSPRLTQVPELRVESQRPKYLARVKRIPKPAAKKKGPNLKSPPMASESLRSLAGVDYPVASFLDEVGTRQGLREERGKATALDTEVSQILATTGRESFETQTGFTVIGARVAYALLAGSLGSCDVFEENGAMHVRVRSDQSEDCVVVGLEGGGGTCLGVMRGFIGTVTAADGRIVNVNYTPSRNSPKWHDYAGDREQVEKRRAFVAAAVRRGILRIDRGQEESFAQYVRAYKYVDPTLGVYATYGFYQGGLLDKVREVFEWMLTDSPSMPFDIALLAGKFEETGVRHWAALSRVSS